MKFIRGESTAVPSYVCRYTSSMIPIGSHPVWHPVFETLAYISGYAVFRYQRDRQGDVIAEPQRWTVLAGAAVGALAGSRILGLAEQWPTVFTAWRTRHLLQLLISPGGKTIVGGLLGAWIGVELVKKLSGIHSRTGDLFALPLCVGIAIGRVGCFIAGLADDTYGKPTSLPPPLWAVDLGDGVGRHPVQIYEILFLTLVALLVTSKLLFLGRLSPLQGIRFRIFLASYLAWRVGIDFLKPQPLVAGLNLIQWSCVLGLIALTIDWALTARTVQSREDETLQA
jgi:phosphatidylglycerol---prolipoprotein diacylglyceryl transferase